jgi:hypothetical protein
MAARTKDYTKGWQRGKRWIVGSGAIAILGLSATVAAAQVTFPPATPSSGSVRSYPSRDNSIPLPPNPSIIPSEDFTPSPIPALTPPPATAFPQQVYRVEIMGSDPFLLSQVQSIAPDAFARQGDGIIQVGSFTERYNAQRQAETLASLGIRANVVTANIDRYRDDSQGLGTPLDRNRASKLPPNFISPSQRNTTNPGRFFVVIPGGDTNQLDRMMQQALALGLQPNIIQEHSEPLGLHLAVGPFASRSEAEVWNTRLRSHGMDARLHFR